MTNTKLILALAALLCATLGAESYAQADTINGVTVPPQPEEKLNDSTKAGIDTDKNGIRDDIDRYIADEFGEDANQLKHARLYAQAEQKMIVTGTPESIDAYDIIYDCSPLKIGKTTDLTEELLNTSERKQAYDLAISTLPYPAPIRDCPAEEVK